MLTHRYVNAQLSQQLLARDAYHPYPTADARGAWEALPTALRDQLVLAGAAYLDYAWPALPATLFMEYQRIGDRVHFETPYFARRKALSTLVLAECAAGDGRFLDDIINGIWAICEETSWVLPAHSDVSRARKALLPDEDELLDLFACETGGLLAWTHYLLRGRLDQVTVRVGERLRQEMTRRILEPYLTTRPWWMGGHYLNNWTPWCTSNCLASVFLLEEDGHRRTLAVERALASLDDFLAMYHPDGGCDEGPSYWTRAGGSLFDCLELLYSATQGWVDVYGEPLVQAIGQYLYKVHISGEYFVDFADGPARMLPPADLLYRYGRRIGDPQLMALGGYCHRLGLDRGMMIPADPLLRGVPAVFNYPELDAAPADAPFLRDVWLDGIEVMAARERQGEDRGLYLAAKGGHNNESHNHNDIGQFVVYADGAPVLVDAGVGVYTAQTFGPHRYEIWTMQSAYHNLPTVNGVQQAAGAEYRATDAGYQADEAEAALALNIATAYPDAAGIARWDRTCRLARGDAPCVTIVDDFALAAPGEVMLSLLTPCEPELAGPGEIILAVQLGRSVRLTYPAALEATFEYLALDDARLRASWGDHLHRLVLRAPAPVECEQWILTVRQA